MLTRRSFAAGAGELATAALLDSRSSLGDITPSGGRLPIPQLIDRIDVETKLGTSEI